MRQMERWELAWPLNRPAEKAAALTRGCYLAWARAGIPTTNDVNLHTFTAHACSQKQMHNLPATRSRQCAQSAATGRSWTTVARGRIASLSFFLCSYLQLPRRVTRVATMLLDDSHLAALFNVSHPLHLMSVKITSAGLCFPGQCVKRTGRGVQELPTLDELLYTRKWFTPYP